MSINKCDIKFTFVHQLNCVFICSYNKQTNKQTDRLPVVVGMAQDLYLPQRTQLEK